MAYQNPTMSIPPPQKLQYPAFQVLWSSKTSEVRRPPLQIRSFTSDSYRTIKEREGKQEHRKRGKNKRWNEAQIRSDQNECLSGKPMGVSRMGIEPNDDGTVLTAEPLLSPPREDSTEVKDTHDLGIIGRPPRCECETQPVHTSSDLVAVSPASPSHTLVTPRLEHLAESKRRSCDTMVEPNRNHNIPSPCALNDALSHECGSFGGSLDDEYPPNKRPAEPKSPMSPQTSGSATGSDLEPSECQIDRDRSLRLAAPHSLSKEVHQPVTNSGSVEPMSAEPFWGDTRRKPGCKGRRMDSMSHTAWTNDADKHLLHLRDVAQLNWQTLISYFPGTTTHGVRQQYRQLKRIATADKATRNRCSSQSSGRNVTPLLSNSHYRTAGGPITKTQTVQWTTRAKRAASAPRRLARCTRPDVQPYGVESAVPSMPSPHRDTPQRSSRRGRAIRHPFRNRPSEGYL